MRFWRAAVRKMHHTTVSPSARIGLRLSSLGKALAAITLLAAGAQAFSQAVPVPKQNTDPAAGPKVHSTAKLAPGRAASYDNKYEIYGGLGFANGQAGQNIPKRYNMGSAEGMFTYWVGSHLGVIGDYRWQAGTTPLLPNPYYNRVVIMQNIYSGGVQWRGPKNRYAAIDYHVLGGASRGTFDHALQNYPGGSPVTPAQVGLYNNQTSPWAAAGGSIDFNYKATWAVRMQPELVVEHFGTETREFFAMSGGVVWRFGHR